MEAELEASTPYT